MNKPVIENKPLYCSAWISKIPGRKVMCNTMPCCGFCIHGDPAKVIDGFMFSTNSEGKLVPDPDKLNKTGSHPLIDGKYEF